MLSGVLRSKAGSKFRLGVKREISRPRYFRRRCATFQRFGDWHRRLHNSPVFSRPRQLPRHLEQRGVPFPRSVIPRRTPDRALIYRSSGPRLDRRASSIQPLNREQDCVREDEPDNFVRPTVQFCRNLLRFPEVCAPSRTPGLVRTRAHSCRAVRLVPPISRFFRDSRELRPT